MNFKDPLEYSNECCCSLVVAHEFLAASMLKCANKKIFVTINPNPKTKHQILKHRKKIKMRYDQLPQRVQYNYLLKIFRKVYYPYLSHAASVLGTYELKNGNMHLHLLIMDPYIQDEYMLQIFQRNISLEPEILRNKNSKNDWMNNIVFVTKPINDILGYMDKDHASKHSLWLNYFMRPEAVPQALKSSQDFKDVSQVSLLDVKREPTIPLDEELKELFCSTNI